MEEMDCGFLEERYTLSKEKIRNILEEGFFDGGICDYFAEVADFLIRLDALYIVIKNKSEEDYRNCLQYQEMLFGDYEKSFANPAYAKEKLGEKYGILLSAFYADLRSLKGVLSLRTLEEVVIRMEVFVEVYSAFVYEWQEERRWPTYESIQQIIYWYISDYSDITAELEVERFLLPDEDERVKRMKTFWLEAEGYPGLLQGMVVADVQTELTRYALDHQADKAIFFDKAMIKRRMEVLRTAMEN